MVEAVVNLVLCPAGSRSAIQNFERSVASPISLSTSDRLRLQMAGQDQVRAWATSSKAKRRWSRVKAGDVLLFFRAKTAFAYARCVGTVSSPELASSIWGSPEWQYLFLLQTPRSISIPVTRMNAAFGYSPRFHVRQLTVLSLIQSHDVWRILGVTAAA